MSKMAEKLVLGENNFITIPAKGKDFYFRKRPALSIINGNVLKSRSDTIQRISFKPSTAIPSNSDHVPTYKSYSGNLDSRCSSEANQRITDKPSIAIPPNSGHFAIFGSNSVNVDPRGSSVADRREKPSASIPSNSGHFAIFGSNSESAGPRCSSDANQRVAYKQLSITIPPNPGHFAIYGSNSENFDPRSIEDRRDTASREQYDRSQSQVASWFAGTSNQVWPSDQENHAVPKFEVGCLPQNTSLKGRPILGRKFDNKEPLSSGAVLWSHGASNRFWPSAKAATAVPKPAVATDVNGASHLMPYTQEIYWHLREIEMDSRPSAAYMLNHSELKPRMRRVLVDWIAEVCTDYELQNETLHLAVAYVDRFLSSNNILKGDLQLVGAASLLIATKFEEIYVLKPQDMVYVTADTYDADQVLKMELAILKCLSFQLTVPTSYGFVRFICGVVGLPEMVRCLAFYISEISLLQMRCSLGFLPSEIAAASVALANFTLDNPPWSEALEAASGYKLSDIMTCIRCLCEWYRDVSKCPQQAICEKYATSAYRAVSRIAPPDIFTRY